MNDASTDWQAVLQTAYLEEAACYARAAQLAGELVAACGRGEPIGDQLRPILDLLDEVALHESRIAPTKASWEQAGRPTGPELRGMMDRIAALIEQLGGQLKTIEQAARERRERLAVELDACNRRRQMQRAYARES
ncbi:MAG TPA: hypothetical protein VN688_13185 [Gemmataceae bacterium]|nr:hypothetical protein [Gemmataceae bacterium]